MTAASKQRKLDRLYVRSKKIVARKLKLAKQWKAADGTKKARLRKRIVKLETRLKKLYDRLRKVQATSVKEGSARKKKTVRRKRASKMKAAATAAKKPAAKKTASKGSTSPRMAAVTSLADLRQRAQTDPRYKELILVAARNLGGSGASVEDAYRVLSNNANETSEEGVVDEINFVRDIVEEKFSKMRAGAAKPTKAKAGSIDPAMLERIKRAAHQTWEYVASDAMNLEHKTTGRDYVSRDLVIEFVTDANRMAQFDKEADAFLSAMDYKDVIKLMKKHVFTQARYD